MISEYAQSLAGRLGFDRALSQCVRQEVEDHLWETASADAQGCPLEAQRRAIANFGDPQVIAAQFAAAWLARQSRRIGVAVMLVIGGLFLAMRARIIWYGMTQWALSGDMRAISETVAMIDRYAFWLALTGGIAGWIYISRRRIPMAFTPSYRRQLQRFFMLCMAVAGALIASVACDAVLTAIRLGGSEYSVRFLVPIVTVAIEIAFAGILISHIRRITRRMAFIGDHHHASDETGLRMLR